MRYHVVTDLVLTTTEVGVLYGLITMGLEKSKTDPPPAFALSALKSARSKFAQALELAGMADFVAMMDDQYTD